ncbi:unnamed protein product [Leptosia nina]|uniref:Uncharacterized protein n=1 Tax=Leptosia nina TaxID=320188 RepID=A0AAV1IUD9_9NEOP
MSFNKNNPNPMGKIMGYLKQLSTEMLGNELRENAMACRKLWKVTTAQPAACLVLSVRSILSVAWQPLSISTTAAINKNKQRDYNSIHITGEKDAIYIKFNPTFRRQIMM